MPPSKSDRKKKGASHRAPGSSVTPNSAASKPDFNPTFTVPETFIQALASNSVPTTTAGTPTEPAPRQEAPPSPVPAPTTQPETILPPAVVLPISPQTTQVLPQPIPNGNHTTQQDQPSQGQDPLDMYLAAVTFARQVAHSERDRADKLKSQAHDLERCADELVKLAEWLDCQIKALSEGLNMKLHVKAQLEYEELQRRDKAEKAERERIKQAAEQSKTDQFLSSLASKVLDLINQGNRRHSEETPRETEEQERQRREELRRREEEMDRQAEAKRKALEEEIMRKAEAKRKAQEAKLLEERKRREDQLLAEEERKRLEQQERDRAEKEQIQTTCDALLKDKDQLAKDKDQLVRDKDQLVRDKDQLARDKDQLARDKDQLAKELDTLRKEAERLKKEEADRVYKEKEQQERRRRTLARQQVARSSITITEAQRYSKAWSTYLSEWEFLTKGEFPGLIAEVTFVHFPWPQVRAPTTPEGITKTSIKDFLFSEHHSEGKSNKIRLREALRRWHPDKSDLLAEKIDPRERDNIREGISLVVRHLNNIKDEMGL